MKSKVAPIALCGLLFLWLFQFSVNFNSFYECDFELEVFEKTVENLSSVLFVSAILLVASVALFCKTNNRYGLYVFVAFTFICYWIFWKKQKDFFYNEELNFLYIFFGNFLWHFLPNLLNPSIIILLLFVFSTKPWKRKLEYQTLTNRQFNALLSLFFIVLTFIFANRQFGTGFEGYNMSLRAFDTEFYFIGRYISVVFTFLFICWIYLLITKKEFFVFSPIVIVLSYIALWLLDWHMEFAYEYTLRELSISLIDIDQAQVIYLFTFSLFFVAALFYFGLRIREMYKVFVQSKKEKAYLKETESIPGYELLTDDEKVRAKDYIRQIIEEKNSNEHE